ncbi:type III effector protein [Ralstonia pseudosolanacearum]|uniref:type III effector protein n=1 Tax=Ralstonia pseudosolanacearum TaxID=1310165 RepID=UPI001FFB4D3C|nr:type III effector protein [Ralstonia pseudosolanacearum]
MRNIQIKANAASYAMPSDAAPESPGAQPPTPKLTHVAAPSGPLANLPGKGTGKLPQVSAQSASPKAAAAGASQAASDALPTSYPEPPQLASLSAASESGESSEAGGAVTISGRLQIDKAGQLTSNNETIRSLIRYLGNDAHHFAHQLDGMQVTIRPHPDAAAAYEALEQLCGVEKALIRSADKPSSRNPTQDAQQEPLLNTQPLSKLVEDEVEGNVLMPMLIHVIEGGAKAFGTQDKMPDQDMSVHQFLASVAPQVEISNPHTKFSDPELSLLFKSKLNKDIDASARLGAATMFQMATQKTFAFKELGMSLAVSSGLGTLWELGGAELIKNALKTLNISPTRYALAAAGIDSAPPIVIETMDSAIVLSAVKAMNRAAASFLTRVREALPAATVAGIKSALGAYANNLLQYMGTGSYPADLALNTVATELAILSAASGIPGEVKENTANMQAAIVEKMREGLLAAPPREPHMSSEEYTQRVKDHVQKLTQQAMDMSPGDGIAQKSLAFASLVGLIPLGLSSKVTNLVSESALRIVRSTVFNPIESIGMNALVATSKINIPGLMSSDANKHEQVTNRILQDAAHDKPLQNGDVHKIFHQWDVLNRAGRTILEGMSLTMDALPNKVARMIKKDPPPLAQRVAYDSIDYHKV